MSGREAQMKTITSFLLFFTFFFSTVSFALDISHSGHNGSYPWEKTPVYEQVAIVSMPERQFNAQLMGLMAQTPFADQMIVPIELRPLMVSMLMAAVIEANFSDEWQVISGAPNPIVEPIFEAVYSLVLKDRASARDIASRLTAMPLMMPDSGGSAVLELKNSLYDPCFLDEGLRYAMALPWKIGFWSDGDLIHIDIINPEALVELFFNGLSHSEVSRLKDIAKSVRLSLEGTIVSSLYAIFPREAVSLLPARLPPFIVHRPGPEERFAIEIGTVDKVKDIQKFLVRPGYPFNDSLLEMENPMMTMAVNMDPKDPNEVMMVHPLLFQTYAAFDGMASFLTSAYQNPTDMQKWIARPDGRVIDDFIFLTAKTYPNSPIYDPKELEFYRRLLGQMFKMTFLRPRGDSITSMEDSAGQKVYMVDIGSPYFGQILLRLGAHRAPGTPCKLIAYREGDSIKVFVYDTRFMFHYFFGDADPRTVTTWGGAFSWPYGQDLSSLAEEARLLYGAYAASALKGLGDTGLYQVHLSHEAEALLKALTPR